MHAELLDCAVKLACSQMDGSPPSQEDLRRSVSTAYYAAFHFVSAQCADLLTCDPGGSVMARAWRQVYRSIRHADVREACDAVTSAGEPGGFPAEIRAFAVWYPGMRRLREEADYEPRRSSEYNPHHVLVKITEADYVIREFNAVAEAHRRAFAILVAVKRAR